MQASLFPEVTLQLTANNSGEQFIGITPLVSSLEATSLVQAIVRINNMGAGFRCRLAIQSAADESILSSPVGLSASDASAYVTAAGVASQKFFRVDPNAAGNGDIDGAPLFRVGLLYGMGTGTQAQGSVTVSNLAWR